MTHEGFSISGTLPTKGSSKSPSQSKSRGGRETPQKHRANDNRPPKLKTSQSTDTKPPQDAQPVKERGRSYSLPNSPAAIVVSGGGLLGKEAGSASNPSSSRKNDSKKSSGKPDAIKEITDSSDSEKENKLKSAAGQSSSHSMDGHSTSKTSPTKRGWAKTEARNEKAGLSSLIRSADKEYKLKSLSEGALLKMKEDSYYRDQLKQEEDADVDDDDDDDEDLNGLKIVSIYITDHSITKRNDPKGHLEKVIKIRYV